MTNQACSNYSKLFLQKKAISNLHITKSNANTLTKGQICKALEKCKSNGYVLPAVSFRAELDKGTGTLYLIPSKSKFSYKDYKILVAATPAKDVIKLAKKIGVDDVGNKDNVGSVLSEIKDNLRDRKNNSHLDPIVIQLGKKLNNTKINFGKTNAKITFGNNKLTFGNNKLTLGNNKLTLGKSNNSSVGMSPNNNAGVGLFGKPPNNAGGKSPNNNNAGVGLFGKPPNNNAGGERKRNSMEPMFGRRNNAPNGGERRRNAGMGDLFGRRNAGMGGGERRRNAGMGDLFGRRNAGTGGLFGRRNAGLFGRRPGNGGTGGFFGRRPGNGRGKPVNTRGLQTQLRNIYNLNTNDRQIDFLRIFDYGLSSGTKMRDLTKRQVDEYGTKLRFNRSGKPAGEYANRIYRAGEKFANTNSMSKNKTELRKLFSSISNSIRTNGTRSRALKIAIAKVMKKYQGKQASGGVPPGGRGPRTQASPDELAALTGELRNARMRLAL